LEKVYISVDLEGMEGVVSKLQTVRKNPDFHLARKRLTFDVNAAVEAAVKAGQCVPLCKCRELRRVMMPW